MTTSISGIDPATDQPITLRIDADRIVGVEPGGSERGFLAPGLIDLQINGYAGIDFNGDEAAAERFGDLARILLAQGVTGFCPTVITASHTDMVNRLSSISDAIEKDPLLALMVAGIHVEGPSIAPEDGPRGAHPRAHVRAPDLDEFHQWQRAAGGRITLLTLSPHWPDAPAFIRGIVAQGICVALGHTAASTEQIRAAVDAGARLSTHLGNGAAAVLPRHPNFIWAQLADTRLTASFIADGHHLPSETLTAMLRAKGLDRSILVSDTAALGGLPPGIYDTPVGGQVEVTPEGRLGVCGTPYLAGAWRNLNECVALATDLAGIPLADSLQMATQNPGRFVGGRGTLAVGERADVIRFGFSPGASRLAIEDVWLAGERIAP